MTMKDTAFLNVSRAQKQASLTMGFSNEGYLGNLCVSYDIQVSRAWKQAFIS